jgi:prepilin-type N-terminal cleavage/methylation domain-containing protein
MSNQRSLKNERGFTLIEILMAVVLVAILTTIGITQFTDFSADAKNSAVKQSLSAMRSALSIQYAQMRLRCGTTGSTWPAVANLQNNDITNGGSPCTTTQVSNPQDRQFLAGGIPQNPWSGSGCTGSTAGSNLSPNSVQASPSMTPVGTAISGVLTSPGCGWLYDTTSGIFRANTKNNNGGAADESSY